ncbi:hypothetical protein N9O95_04575, partial [Alphaproteobacteria bacterium]|nr:hypothetical protein [Alphaproteobacteria bacterium]
IAASDKMEAVAAERIRVFIIEFLKSFVGRSAVEQPSRGSSSVIRNLKAAIREQNAHVNKKV